jgi:hypothetical protein
LRNVRLVKLPWPESCFSSYFIIVGTFNFFTNHLGGIFMAFRSGLLFVGVAFLAVSCAKSNSGSGSNGSGSGASSAAAAGPQEPFPHLGTSASFAALSGVMVTNTGPTIIYGDVGVSPGTQITGMQLVKRTGGADHANDSAAAKAQVDSVIAYNNLKTKSCDHDLTGQDLGGMTLTPGTYCFSGDANLSGILTLDAQGNSNANFIFQVAGNLTASYNTAVTVIHNGESCDVFWQVGGMVNLAGMANFAGGILAMGDITLGTEAKLNGKLLSRNGSITMDSAEIYNNFCPWPGP